MENNSGSEPETEKSTAKAYSTSDKKNTHSRTHRCMTRFFNVRAWADWDRSKAITQYFLRVFERVLIPKKLTIKHKTASFDAVVAQLNLSEKELQARARGLLRLSYILGFMAFGLGTTHYQPGAIRWLSVFLILLELAGFAGRARPMRASGRHFR